MSASFLEMFRDICAEIDKVVKPEARKAAEPDEAALPRYNVHKRSLPVGLDKPVAYFLTKGDADLILKRLKAKLNADGVLTYYDIVLNTGKNGSVYHNGVETVRAEGSDDAAEAATEWVG